MNQIDKYKKKGVGHLCQVAHCTVHTSYLELNTGSLHPPVHFPMPQALGAPSGTAIVMAIFGESEESRDSIMWFLVFIPYCALVFAYLVSHTIIYSIIFSYILITIHSYLV